MAIDRFTNVSEKLLSDIQRKQSLINKDVKKKRMLSKKQHLLPRDVNMIQRINTINKKRGKLIKNYREKLRKAEIQLQKHTLNLTKPHFAPLSKKDKNGYFIRFRIHPLLLVADETIDDLVGLIRDKLQYASKTVGDGRTKHHMKISDTTIKNIRLNFCDVNRDFASSVNCKSLDECREKLVLEMNKHNAHTAEKKAEVLRLRGGAVVDGQQIPDDVHEAARIAASADDSNDDDWYDRYLMAVDFFFFNVQNNVGCTNKTKQKYVFNLSPNELIYLYNPRSLHNRCFDTCLIKGMDIKSKIRAYDIRRKNGIDTKCKIDPKSDEARKIADVLQVGYIVYNGIVKSDRLINDDIDKTFKKYTAYGTDKYKKIIKILKIAGHCYLINNTKIYKRRCEQCGIFRKYGITDDHKCNKDTKNYYQTKICKNDVILPTNLRREKKRNWIIFDLETLPCGKGETHLVYAVGWYDYMKKQYYHLYGDDCFSKFMDWIDEHGQDKTYIAYNGCNFDFYFLQKELLNRNIETKSIRPNGRILTLQWGKVDNGKTVKWKNRVWDLCQFMPGFSLKKACEDFDTEIQKTSFDHARMHDWDCVLNINNKIDCLKYLYHDVMSLVELTDKYVTSCEEEYDASPTKYLTISSFAESVWKSGLEEMIEVPDMEKQHFIRKSVYGGRTYPCRKRFQSKIYKTIKSNKSNKHKLKILYKELLKDGDYIFNGDINSQYPACMAGCELMPTLYPTGLSQWIDDPIKAEQIFNTNKQLGIYEIEFTCPNKKLRHAILPRKKIVQRKNGKQIFTGVEWSLLDGRGTYNTIDIQNAIKHGYKIKFVGKALVWEDVSDKIYHSYVNMVYAKKVKASIDNNKAKRAIAKLMMNSLYGKTLQNPISKSECIARSNEHDKIETFLSTHILTDWEIMESDDTIEYIFLTGEKISDVRISKKPTHLGSMILAYSRRLWLMFLETIDPTLESEITTYLDTDSLHISGLHSEILRQAGMIHDDKLGYLSNDCKNNALIINEINLSPKCYMYECLTEDGEIKLTMKSKGIMKEKLTEFQCDDGSWASKKVPVLQQHWYEKDEPQPAEWTGFKKVHKTICSSDKSAGITNFAIKKQKYNRTFNKQQWTGMMYDDGYFYPFGYKK